MAEAGRGIARRLLQYALVAVLPELVGFCKWGTGMDNNLCKTQPNEITLVHGAVYIAARVIEMFDQPTMAVETLKTAGFTVEDYMQAAESDLEILRPYMPELPIGR